MHASPKTSQPAREPAMPCHAMPRHATPCHEDVRCLPVGCLDAQRRMTQRAKSSAKGSSVRRSERLHSALHQARTIKGSVSPLRLSLGLAPSCSCRSCSAPSLPSSFGRSPARHRRYDALLPRPPHSPHPARRRSLQLAEPRHLCTTRERPSSLRFPRFVVSPAPRVTPTLPSAARRVQRASLRVPSGLDAILVLHHRPFPPLFSIPSIPLLSLSPKPPSPFPSIQLVHVLYSARQALRLSLSNHQPLSAFAFQTSNQLFWLHSNCLFSRIVLLSHWISKRLLARPPPRSGHTPNLATMPSSRAVKMAAVALPAALLASTALAASESCISLKGSSMCPSFQNNFVRPSNLSSEFGFFETVTDVASFDSLFQYYMTS